MARKRSLALVEVRQGNFLKALISLEANRALDFAHFFQLLDTLPQEEKPFLSLFILGDNAGKIKHHLASNLRSNEPKRRALSKALVWFGLYPRLALEILGDKFKDDEELFKSLVNTVFIAHATIAREIAISLANPQMDHLLDSLCRATDLKENEILDLVQSANLLFSIIRKRPELFEDLYHDEKRALLRMIPYRRYRESIIYDRMDDSWRIAVAAEWGKFRNFIETLIKVDPTHGFLAYDRYHKQLLDTPEDAWRYVRHVIENYPSAWVVKLLKKHNQYLETLIKQSPNLEKELIPLLERAAERLSIIGRGELLLMDITPQSLRDKYLFSIDETHLVQVVAKYYSENEELQKNLFPKLPLQQKIEAGEHWPKIPTEWLIEEFKALLANRDEALIVLAGEKWKRLPKDLLYRSVQQLKNMNHIIQAVVGWGIDEYAIQRRVFYSLHGINAYVAGKKFKKLKKEDLLFLFPRLRGEAAYLAGREWEGIPEEMLRDAFVRRRLTGNSLFFAAKEWKGISDEDRRTIFIESWQALKGSLPYAGKAWSGISERERIEVFRQIKDSRLLYNVASMWDLPQQEVLAREDDFTFQQRVKLCERYPGLVERVLRELPDQDERGIEDAWNALHEKAYREQILPHLLRCSDEVIAAAMRGRNSLLTYEPSSSLRNALLDRVAKSEELSFMLGAARWLNEEECAMLWQSIQDPEKRRNALSYWPIFEELKGESFMRFLGNTTQALAQIHARHMKQGEFLKYEIKRALNAPEEEDEQALEAPKQLGLSFL